MREGGSEDEGYTWGQKPGSHQSAATRSSESKRNRKKVEDVKSPKAEGRQRETGSIKLEE